MTRTPAKTTDVKSSDTIPFSNQAGGVPACQAGIKLAVNQSVVVGMSHDKAITGWRGSFQSVQISP
jgi:hypothetical protein